MRALTGMEVGGLTAFGLPPGLPLWVDSRVFELDWVILGGGGRHYKVKVKPAALEAVGAQPIAGLATPMAPQG
jgi:prolyl-tRNA editing enzyme YbaK/EbsC (Cys-tRNA(Pro) deacylase)